MRPLIGITLCLDERRRWHPERETAYLDGAYAAALAAAGASPVLLPLASDVSDVTSRLDGLLLPGGDDFLPPRAYPPEVRFDPVPPRQLAFDEALLAAALARGLPVLAICYGMQLLARQRGAGLIYDIPSDRPDAGPHRLPEAGARHGLRVEPGSQLAKLLGDAAGPVNSSHHQGVAEPGRGLRVAARADDGLIEAIEGEGFCLGVQWHPERMPDPHRARLFGGFVEACRARARGGG
jgi:gamma-glutamyl-gamma-aminobutyrate hydrolase PuuD